MEVNPITRSLNLPPSPVVPSNTPAADKVKALSAETARVTPPPATGDSASHGATSGNRGLGNHVNFYDTRPTKRVHLLGNGTGLPEPGDLPADPHFPFLVPLGSRSSKGGKKKTRTRLRRYRLKSWCTSG